ncbi:MAG TPA: CPBP family intramembrane glutamic endopeptidase [Candidatus Angelobacter sp.]
MPLKLPTYQITQLPNSPQFGQRINKHAVLVIELIVAYTLILVTIWTSPGAQRVFFYITAAWFLLSLILAINRGEPAGLERLPLRMTILTVLLTVVIAIAMAAIAYVVGTLHGLFGVRQPLLHASTYLLWSLVQQYIQQSFFFARIEQLTSTGRLASLITALLFGLAHLPNPVLAPVTFVGGWILCELFRRYRSLYPLAVAHGLIGLAIAISVPDQIHHHMRVGLGYLRYPK